MAPVARDTQTKLEALGHARVPRRIREEEVVELALGWNSITFRDVPGALFPDQIVTILKAPKVSECSPRGDANRRQVSTSGTSQQSFDRSNHQDKQNFMTDIPTVR